ncbi:hypothetical protein ACFLZG_05850 [Thermodesulfobacteriota bacterium]
MQKLALVATRVKSKFKSQLISINQGRFITVWAEETLVELNLTYLATKTDTATFGWGYRLDIPSFWSVKILTKIADNTTLGFESSM